MEQTKKKGKVCYNDIILITSCKLRNKQTKRSKVCYSDIFHTNSYTKTEILSANKMWNSLHHTPLSLKLSFCNHNHTQSSIYSLMNTVNLHIVLPVPQNDIWSSWSHHSHIVLNEKALGVVCLILKAGRVWACHTEKRRLFQIEGAMKESLRSSTRICGPDQTDMFNQVWKILSFTVHPKPYFCHALFLPQCLPVCEASWSWQQCLSWGWVSEPERAAQRQLCPHHLWCQTPPHPCLPYRPRRTAASDPSPAGGHKDTEYQQEAGNRVIRLCQINMYVTGSNSALSAHFPHAISTNNSGSSHLNINTATDNNNKKPDCGCGF